MPAHRPAPSPRRRPGPGGFLGGAVASVAATYREAFSGLPPDVWRLSLVILVHRSGTMVLPFLALYLTGPLGTSVEMAGVALGTWGLGAVVGTYAGGRLTDRYGAFAVQAVSLVAGGAGFLVLGFLRTPASFFAGLLVTAACVDAFRPANAVALAEVAPPRLRSRAFALRRGAINLGMTLGPLAGGFLARVDYTWLFVVDGLTCLAAMGLLAVYFRRRSAEERAAAGRAAAAPPAPSPLRDRPFFAFLLLSAVLTAVLFQFLSAFPVALRDSYGLDESRIGLVFAVNTVLILAFEMVLMHRLAMVPPLRLVAWGGLFVGLGYGLVPFGADFAFAAVVIAVVTVGEMLGLPPAETYAASRVEGPGRGRYLGLFNLSHAVALTAGPAIGTWVYGRFGGSALWTACAVAGAAMWLGFAALERAERSSSSRRRLRHRPPP
jgi:predicted MFS family arabinose efflux permease